MMMIGSVANVVLVMAGAFVPVIFGSHLTQDQMASATTISTALTSIIAAFMTSPVSLGLINSGVTTALIAGTSFGLHMSPEGIAALTAGVTTVLSYLMREKVRAVARST